ncbi:MAG: hypothetical protein U1F56_11340 [Rubrivivax sp.]
MSTDPAAPADGALQLLRPRDPGAALGWAVSYLMTDPAFARQPFGDWSRVLAGQVNRGHCVFVHDGRRLRGFAGWALTDDAGADAWLAGRTLDADAARQGPVVLVNALKFDGDAVRRRLLRALRGLLPARRLVARRAYADGRWRAVDLRLRTRSAA